MEENKTERTYSFWKIRLPENIALFQIMIEPPEAPLDGRNSNRSKQAGQIIRIKALSNTDRLVS
jgi:hypothetical protein